MKSAVNIKRDEAYIGVLIDDLITKGTEEPNVYFSCRIQNVITSR
jgi:tRNA uridine 5-carboxymethylaminomethyl modification enzyme